MPERIAPKADGDFAALWRRCAAVDGADAAWAALDKGYGSVERAYHNWDHIRAMLAGLAIARREAEFASARVDEVRLAVYFHDAIYQADQSDNEEQSAALFRTLAGDKPLIGADGVERTLAMILATKHHAATADLATRLMLDLDLAVLGTEADGYRRYASAIRREYAFVAEDAWRVGRTAVLRRFLERDRIFQSNIFYSRLETQARSNLAWEIGELTSEA